MSFVEALSRLEKVLAPEDILAITRGIEKESLRVTPKGTLSQKNHPIGLGASLTHRFITTDFAESLPELITPPVQGIDQLLKYLHEIHYFTYQHLGDEMLWPMSMPGPIAAESDIRIAEYGKSHSAKMKEIYRHGLAMRYGKWMQAIAGLHYNFSLPESLLAKWQQALGDTSEQLDFTSSQYMGMCRRFLATQWLLPYLFGASPIAAESSLVHQHPQCLTQFSADTWGSFTATSLRMSPVGYQNDAQGGIVIDFSDTQGYAKSLLEATQTPYPPFTELGVKTSDGQYLQLNDSVIQIENEYYSTIRPKQIATRCERPAMALIHRGVAYIEVRILDLDPFSPVGITEDTIRFMDVFMIWCLLTALPSICQTDCQQAKDNLAKVILQGLDPEVQLSDCTKNAVPLVALAEPIAEELSAVATLLDQCLGAKDYTHAVSKVLSRIHHSKETLASRLLNALEAHNGSVQSLGMDLAGQHREVFKNYQSDQEIQAILQQEVASSIAAKEALEAKQCCQSFEDFLACYFLQGKAL